MTKGRLFVVVGPSGAGKDTVLEGALEICPHVHRLTRVVTRPTGAGGEDFEGVSSEVFAKMEDECAFAFTWHAHGLSYGIPIKLEMLLNDGKKVVFNGSRKALHAVQAKYPKLKVLLVHADRATLQKRLIARGRETLTEIEGRLMRAETALPDGLDIIRISNSGALCEAVQKMASTFMGQEESVQ